MENAEEEEKSPYLLPPPGMSNEERKPHITQAGADNARWLKEKETYDLGKQE